MGVKSENCLCLNTLFLKIFSHCLLTNQLIYVKYLIDLQIIFQFYLLIYVVCFSMYIVYTICFPFFCIFFRIFLPQNVISISPFLADTAQKQQSEQQQQQQQQQKQ